MLDLEHQWQSILTVLGVLMTRMLVAFSVIPLFVGNTVPTSIRVIFVTGLAFALLPMAMADRALIALPLDALSLYVAKEAAVGLVLGLIASVGFWSLYVAGAIVEYQAGLSFATTIDPLTGQDESLLGSFLMRLYVMLFLVTGGLHALIGMLFESYRVWPMASLGPRVDNLELATIATVMVGRLLQTAIQIAAPFVILLLLLELSIGLLSRFAPQLNAFFVALPLKVLLLSVLLLIYGMLIAASGYTLPLADFSHALDPFRGDAR
jgi:type III secretion protein T